jgi:uncharacterized protein
MENPMSRSAALRQATIFVGLVYLLVVLIALALPDADVAAPLLSMMTPLVVLGLITAFAPPRGGRGELWRSFGLRRLALRSWPVAIAVPLALILIVPWTVAAWLGFATFALSPGDVPAWVVTTAVAIVATALLALGEEIGWRGYLLPRVQALVSKRKAALVVGFIHGLFHLPLMLLTTTYNSVGNRAVMSTTMVLTLTVAGVFYAWLKDRSGTVWPVTVAHGAVNTFIDGAGLFLVVSPLALAYTAGETGLVTLLAMTLGAVALLCIRSAWAPTASTTAPTASPSPTEEALR